MGAAVVRRRRPRPISYGLLKIKPKVGTSPFLQTMGSVFDFPSMAAVAGAWFVWQNYLVSHSRDCRLQSHCIQVNLVPTTVLSDFVSSLNLGRSSESPEHKEILESIQDFIRKQQSLSLLNKQKKD